MREDPLFFHFIVVLALSPFPLASPSLFLAFRLPSVLYSFPSPSCPSPRITFHPFPSYPPTYAPSTLYPLPFPFPDAIPYHILYNHTRYSVLFYYTYARRRRRRGRERMYVCIDGVMGGKKIWGYFFLSIFDFYILYSVF